MGFPDVSALGHNYLVFIDNDWELVDGTSCSSPVWAGLIALHGDYELKNGRPTLGFINPLIYQSYSSNPGTFNDIVNGGNRCTESACCESGLGTPNFDVLYNYTSGLSQKLYVPLE